MSDRLRSHLRDILAADLSANVLAMRLLVEAASASDAAEAVTSARAEAEEGSRGAEQLDAVAQALARNPDAWARVHLVLKEADHARIASPGHWAAVFDRLASVAPDEAVALYALGSPDLARETADEIVDLLRRWSLIGPQARVLDLGCGVGRLSFALAPHVASVFGLDVSAGMVAEAGRRAAFVENVRFETTNGRDLDGLPDASFDLVLASDVFPYLVGADDSLPDSHVQAAARVLTSDGALAIFNYSYRGDDALDRADVSALCAKHGFAVEVAGTRGLALWDGLAFVGRKR